MDKAPSRIPKRQRPEQEPAGWPDEAGAGFVFGQDKAMMFEVNKLLSPHPK